MRTDRADPFTMECDSPLTVVVADGMGGHAGGAVASAVATSAFFAEHGGLLERVLAADRAVHDRSAGDPRLRGMGTTLVGVCIDEEGQAHIVGVGDSRVYRQLDGYLGILTEDDRIDGTPALTRYVGDGRAKDARLSQYELVPGDRLVLTSDGVHDVIDDDRLGELVSSGSLTSVRDAVLAEGAPDNFSIVIVEVLGPVMGGVDAG